VSTEIAHSPAARSWREIPQPVKPRAMSSGGRWRLVMAGVRSLALVGFIAGCGWGVWMIVGALHDDPRRMPAEAKAVPLRPPELKTMRDGVLDSAWLARTLELPPRVSLLELDLDKLSARVLADQQVLTVGMRKIFPDRLEVQITERTPVARVHVAMGDTPRDLLVARDGVVFFGTGFDPLMVRSLPWLEGITLAQDGARFLPIAHMADVARLLAEAQFSAPHLYHQWHSVSLARMELDREAEVTLKTGTKARFSAKGNFFVQLAHLDDIVERLGRNSGSQARIDLTLGREVPVTLETVSTEARAVPLIGGAVHASPLFPRSPSNN
jgi:hypothetical protein